MERIMEKIYNTNLIENYIKTNKISKTKFCKLCKISTLTFDKITKQNLRIGIKSINRICKYIKVPLREIFNVENQSTLPVSSPVVWSFLNFCWRRAS